MADDSDKITSGGGGNTGGTGGPAYSGTGEGGGAGAAGPPGHAGRVAGEGGSAGGAPSEAQHDEEFEQASPELRQAIEGGSNAADTGPRGGKLSSEGTGSAGGAPDPGDPGGMGGAGASPPNHDHRPPGGVSPLSRGKPD